MPHLARRRIDLPQLLDGLGYPRERGVPDLVAGGLIARNW